MKAMVLENIGAPLMLSEREAPEPGPDEILIEVQACAVCRTDLHVIDGDLPNVTTPRIPGHEIVGRIVAKGGHANRFEVGRIVGIPWLGGACGRCGYCASGAENLCDEPIFTGYTRDGGFATHVVALEQFAIPLPSDVDAISIAPLLCAGLIGWRSLVAAGEGRRIGLYGFGAAAHIIAQVASWQGKQVYAFTKSADIESQRFAKEMGAIWVGSSDQSPPESLDAAIIFAPVGGLIPIALRQVRKGGRVVCAGIHMSDIPSFAYSDLWGERHLLSVANLTRKDASDFFGLVPRIGIKTRTTVYALEAANEAIADLRAGSIQGAAVLRPEA